MAGAGLCDVDAVHVLVTEGPRRVRELMELGAEFDTRDGVLELAIEGGHSLPRVVHAGGDATGAEIERALADAAHALPGNRRSASGASPSTSSSRTAGASGSARSTRTAGRSSSARATRVLATGGAGQLFSVTTNPPVSTGDGIAMALRAGVAVADVEFMQFHPTAMDHPRACRGRCSPRRCGARARSCATSRACASWSTRTRGPTSRRATSSRARSPGASSPAASTISGSTPPSITDFPEKFPTIWASAQRAGLDPRVDFLPVAPAAHYLSGGIVTDLDGASTLPGLWSCGEAACSGVHGANRLASNSLLDGLVFAPRIVEAILAGKDAPEATGVMRGVDAAGAAPAPPAAAPVGAITLDGAPARDDGRCRCAARRRRAWSTWPRSSASTSTRATLPTTRCATSWPWRACSSAAARAREESRGTHTRLDFPETSEAFAGRFVTRGGPLEFVPLPAEVPA